MFLVLDQGGHSSRALVFDSSSTLVASASTALSASSPQSAYFEQDPTQLVQSLRNAADSVCREVFAAHQRLPVAAALVCQRSSLLCWRRSDGQPLCPVLSWQDQRGADILDELLKKIPRATEQIKSRTGLFPSVYFGASKLAWLLRNDRSVAQALEDGELCFGPLASFLVSQLGQQDRHCVDSGNAQRTMLWNLYSQDWDEELLNWFSIPRQILPGVQANNADYGSVQFDSRQIPLRYVNGDQNAAFLSHGEPEPKNIYANVGTGAFVARACPPDKALAGNCGTERLLYTIVDSRSLEQSGQAIYMLEGTVNGAASLLDWATEAFDCALDFSKLNGSYAEHSNSQPDFLVVNAVGGIGSPYWDKHLQTAIYRYSLQGQQPSFARLDSGQLRALSEEHKAACLAACLDSIIFYMQVNIDLLAGPEAAPQGIVLGGGLSRLDAFCQGLANLSNLRVHRQNMSESTARGAAYALFRQCVEPAQQQLENGWHRREEDLFLPMPHQMTARLRCWQRLLQCCLDAEATLDRPFKG